MKVTDIPTEDLIKAVDSIHNRKPETTFFQYRSLDSIEDADAIPPQIQTVFDVSELEAELDRRQKV